jgi:predicted transcriptional regulator
VVRYVKDTYYTDQGVLSDILTSEVIGHEQLENMAAAVLSSGKFNQDTVCKAAQISASDYGKLAVEMMEQGLINLKGKTAKQGYNITKRGYDCLGHLVTPTPPLLE